MQRQSINTIFEKKSQKKEEPSCIKRDYNKKWLEENKDCIDKKTRRITRKKKSRKGLKMNPETIAKIVEAKKKKRKIQPDKICLICGETFSKKEVVESNSSYERKKFCSVECREKDSGQKSIERWKKEGNPAKGTKRSLEFRKNLSDYWTDNPNHNRYIDGRSRQRGRERLSDMGRLEYKLWRESVFKRDNFTCQHCGQIGGKLNADHIKPWSLFPEFRYDIDNGQTLCYECHRKTPTFAGRGSKLTREDF